MKTKNNLKTATQLAALVSPLLISAGNAATIAVAGSIVDDSGNEITEWRTAGTSKTSDIDGDNIYGTFGRIAFGDPAPQGALTFISAQRQVGPFLGYATIDEIGGIPGSDRQVRTTTNDELCHVGGPLN